MFQVRIHGRGGQGVVTAAEMLSLAAFIEGKYAQAFPSFGSERTGAPVVSFCRIDDKKIRSREPIMAPDAIIIQDPTLLHQIDVFSGLKPNGYVLLNTSHNLAELGLSNLSSHPQIRTLAATELALKHIKRPIPNVALIAGLAAMSNLIHLDSVLQAIQQKLAGKMLDGNLMAAQEAYELLSTHEENTHA